MRYTVEGLSSLSPVETRIMSLELQQLSMVSRIMAAKGNESTSNYLTFKKTHREALCDYKVTDPNESEICQLELLKKGLFVVKQLRVLRKQLVRVAGSVEFA